jgi:hypothetical protein
MRVLVSLLVFIRLRNTPPLVKIYVMEANLFLGYLKWGIACLVSPFGHEQYPSNSLDQNNSAHGVIMYLNEGIAFLLGFVKATQNLSKFQKIGYGAQTILRYLE